MQPLFVALAYCVGVILGARVSPRVAPEAAMWCLAAGSAGFVLAWKDWRGASAALIGLAALLGCARACTCAHPLAGSEARGGPRLVEVRTAGASVPGPRCRVALEGGGELSVPVDACPRVPGERLVLPARARTGDLGGIWPQPRSSHRSRRSKTRVESERVYPRGVPPTGYWAWVAEQRQRAWVASRGDAATALVMASALGMRTALPPGDRGALRAAGLGHLIAVSGLHVGVAALLFHALALRIAWMFGASPRTAVVASWLPLFAYVGLTGAAASAVRAALMLVLVGLGTASGRPAHGIASLATTAMIMLAVEPSWVFDAGFWLSIAAMAAIVTAPPGLGTIGHSWRITWSVAPFSWWYFGEASAYGLLSNLVAIPMLALWILPTAVLGWLAWPWLGEHALGPARMGAEIVLALAHVVGRLPRPGASTLAWAAGLAIAGTVVRHRLRRRAWIRGLDARGVFPPLLASAGLLAVLGTSSTQVPASSWYALGGRRSLAIVAPSPAGDHVCIRSPRWTPSLWTRLLHALEIERVRAVVASPGDPTADALREDLRARGVLGDGVDDCAIVDEERARAALTRCLERRGTRRGIVRGDRSGARLHCFAAERWRLLPSEVP